MPLLHDVLVGPEIGIPLRRLPLQVVQARMRDC